jgi:hypothetical protein
VTASNIGGAGAPASLAVTWELQPPVCTISAAPTSSPTIGTNVTLTANCSGNPTNYAWSANTTCGSTATCVTTSAALGTVTYSVTATNAAGPGPAATKDIIWSPPSADRCDAYVMANTLLTSNLTWGQSNRITTAAEGGFQGAGAWTTRVTIPGTIPVGRVGAFTVSEYQGAPISRTATLSKDRCDFRPLDPTGQNGPIAVGYGSSATLSWTVGSSFAPGQSYYINVRNVDGSSGQITCSQATCEAALDYQWRIAGP